jgi:hypothetical protein
VSWYKEINKRNDIEHDISFIKQQHSYMLRHREVIIRLDLEYMYEGRLISNAHSEISTKRYHVFKQTKVGSKVKYFSYKLTYLFFNIFPNVKQVYACRQ